MNIVFQSVEIRQQQENINLFYKIHVDGGFPYFSSLHGPLLRAERQHQ